MNEDLIIQIHEFIATNPDSFFTYDSRIFDEPEVDLTLEIQESPIKFNNPSIQKLIKRANIDPTVLSNEAIEYISSIIYTRLYNIISKSLIMRDERNVKILTHNDIINALRMDGEEVICSPPNRKS